MIARSARPIAEIVERFPTQYLLLDSCRFDDTGRLTHARVVENAEEAGPVYDGLRVHPNSVIIYSGPDSLDHEGAFLDSGQVWESAQV